MIEVRVPGRDKKAASLYRFLHWQLRYTRREVEPAVEAAMLRRILHGADTLADVVRNFKRAVPILR